jgi:UDP-N-acetylglucosamine diphosphorylase/glucosamine-1-phosphate N-acetyltransferase
MSRIEQAVILVAGEGQRLKPFTTYKPKPLISIANKPILQYIIEALATNGLRHIVMIVGYKKEQIQDYFGSGSNFGVDIEYIVQKQQLGTGNALKQAKGHLHNDFLVLAGDNIIDSNTIATFIQQAPNALLVKESQDVTQYGMVLLDKGKVKSIVEKAENPVTSLISTGTYLFTKDIFTFVEQEPVLTSALKKMIMSGYEIAAYKTEGIWLDVVYPWDILDLNKTALETLSPSRSQTIEHGVTIKGNVSIGVNTIIRANSYITGPAIIGESCDIGPSVYIAPSTSIGSNVIISPFTEIKNSVIGNNVEIGSGSVIEDSIIDKGCIIKGRFTARSEKTSVSIDSEHHFVKIGAMLGESCTISDGVTIYPGISVGTKAQIKELKVIRDSIPNGALVA